MPAKYFRAYNGATGALTGTTILSAQSTAATVTPRTMLQVAPAATAPSIRVIGWGYTFLTAPTNNVTLELLDTNTVFASGLTAHVAANIHRMNVPAGEASTVQLGTALTGYSAGSSTEGTLGSSNRLLDMHYENGLYWYWRFELGREPEVQPGNCLRLRATPSTAASVSLICWIDWEE